LTFIITDTNMRSGYLISHEVPPSKKKEPSVSGSFLFLDKENNFIIIKNA